LAHFDNLDRAGARVFRNPAPFRPGVCVVMVADIGQQDARIGLVDDDADVAAHADRPEMRVARAVDAVKL
jgi:hypothetical protein